MQEFLTWLVIGLAVIIFGLRTARALKAFKKKDSCDACGSSCGDCHAVPGRRKIKSR